MLLTLIVCLTTCCSSGAADISSPDEPGKEDKTTCIIVTKATKTARMTGQPVPGETIPSPNNTPVNYNIGGTDLGIFWKMSDNKVGILFGDTYGKAWRPGYTPEWRSNAMAWNPQWVTNWSGFAVSEDDGNTWELHKNIYSSDSKFAQMALWEKDEYIYSIGSIIGRRGLPYAARFKKEDILNPDKWEYWNSSRGWDKGRAVYSTPMFGNTKNEMYAEPTLVFHEYFNKWITVYYNEIKNRMGS